LEHSTKENGPVKIIVASERGKELTRQLIEGKDE
jgi:hypothetical protein